MIVRRLKWLVVGSTGRVGRLLQCAWAKSPPAEIEPVYQARGSEGFSSTNLKWVPFDGADALKDWINVFGAIEGMIVLGGVTNGDRIQLAENARIAEACLRAAKQLKIRNVFVASSSAVYGKGQGRPFLEEDKPEPANEYGRAKVDMEKVCNDWRDNDLNVVCLRIGNIAGADSLLSQLSSVAAEKPLRLDQFDDGHGPRRSYVGPNTFADVLAWLASKPNGLPEVLNLATPKAVWMDDLVDVATPYWEFVAAPVGAVQNLTLDCSRLSALYDFPEESSNPVGILEELLLVEREK